MKKEISIDEEVYRDIEALYKKKAPEMTLEEYIAQVLKQGIEAEEEVVYKPHDEEAIKERLKSLGYID